MFRRNEILLKFHAQKYVQDCHVRFIRFYDIPRSNRQSQPLSVGENNTILSFKKKNHTFFLQGPCTANFFQYYKILKYILPGFQGCITSLTQSDILISQNYVHHVGCIQLLRSMRIVWHNDKKYHLTNNSTRLETVIIVWNTSNKS